MYCGFYAIARLDLAQAVLLNFSAPLYIAPIAWLWLGEAITGRLMLSALIGFAGVALILKPGTAPFSTDAAIGALSGLLAAHRHGVAAEHGPERAAGTRGRLFQRHRDRGLRGAARLGLGDARARRPSSSWRPRVSSRPSGRSS